MGTKVAARLHSLSGVLRALEARSGMSFSQIQIPSPPPLDPDLLAAASASLQAHEQLYYEMKTRLKGQPHCDKAISECAEIMDNLRHLKSKIDGTYFNFHPIALDKDRLSQLKYDALAHTPATLNEKGKAKITEQLAELFDGQIKKLVYACILTCPWFAAAQSETSAQASRNILYVVYIASDEHFFSLATPHEKQLCETVDEGVVFACEVRHFCSQLLSGNVRSIEALCCPPECLVLCSQEWFGLVGLLDPKSLINKAFVSQCLGQSVGALVKKKKVKGRLVLRDDTSLEKFADSFRLLGYLETVSRGRDLLTWTGNPLSELDPCVEAGEAMELLKQGFQGVVSKERMLEVVMRWKERIESAVKPAPGAAWTTELGQWLAHMRLDGVTLSPVPSISDSEAGRLKELLTSLGFPDIKPENVLVVAECGSRLYNLALPTSDTDYLVVYRHSTQDLISAHTHFKESHDNRGQQLDREAGVYEARMFCEMLLKGATNCVELVFADETQYCTEAWEHLVENRGRFISEKVVLQYIGYVQTHMSIIEKKKLMHNPQEAKKFYSIFHKLLSLERFAEGKPPVVRCSGEEQEFIMKIRRGPLEGDLHRDELYSLAVQRLKALRTKLRSRDTRMAEFGDYRFLQSWLLAIRGVELKQPLLMATKPLASLPLDDRK